MSIELKTNNFRKTFAEICEGFSKTFYRDEIIYIKHLSHLDYVYYEDIQNQFEEDARKKKLPDEQQKLDFLIKNNLWSKKKESEIEQIKDFIGRLSETKKKQILPSAIKDYERQIKEEEDKLKIILDEKYLLIGMTVESYSQRMVNDYYIINNIYKDSKCSELFFNKQSFEDLEDEEVSNIITIYNKSSELFSDDNLRKLSLQEFYQSYYYLCNDNLMDFYGKPIINLTFHQVKLGNYSKYFKSLLESTESNKIPKEARFDPDKLENYINAKRESDKVLENSNANGATSLVGATNQDLEELGLQNQVAKFPNKEMNSQELMKFLTG